MCATNETDIITWRTMKPSSVNPTTGGEEEEEEEEEEESRKQKFCQLSRQEFAVEVAAPAPLHG